MKISVDDYEAIMAMAQLIVDSIGSQGIQTDPIDVAADIYAWINKMSAAEDIGVISSGGITVIFMPEDEEEEASFNVYMDVGQISADGVHYVFDGPELEYMDSVPEDMIATDEDS